MSLGEVISEQELDIIAQKLSKVYNMPPEEVKKTLQAVFSSRDRLDRLREKVSRLKEMKPIIDEMPEGARDIYYNLLFRELIDSMKDEDYDRLIKLSIIRDLREGRSGGDSDAINRLEARLDELAKTVQEVVKAQQNKVFEELVKKVDALAEEVKKVKESPPTLQKPESEEVRKVLEQIEVLRKEIEELKKSPPLANRIETTFKEIETIKSTLEKYGMIATGAGANQLTVNPDKLAEELKKYGYEVRKLTPEDVQKYLEEYGKRVREEVASELQIERARIESTKELIKAGIDSVVKPIMDTIAEAMRESFRQSLRMRLAQQYAQSLQTQQQVQQQPVKSSSQVQQQQPVQGGRGAEGGAQGGGEKSG
jgi:F0F1-type ATP synthase membrane subunit b/b'